MYWVCLVVILAIGIGAVCGYEWQNLNLHSSSVAAFWGVPEDWIWFISFVVCVSLCSCGFLIFPLCVSRAQAAREVVHSQTRLGKKGM